MTLRVSFSAQALRDIELALDHYERVAGDKVGADFLDEIQRLSNLMSDVPGMGRPTSGSNDYVLTLSRFPYHLFYRRMNERELRILRIRHARRRPLNP